MLISAIVLFSAVMVLYVFAEKRIERANDVRHLSFMLADELRQSSDDLTRMVRSYVVSGDRIYKQHYQEILDIRDGVKPRPLNYEYIYWDLVLADDRRPTGYGEKAPLLEIMKQAGFTEAELSKLIEAKANSDALTRLEYDAMALLESTTPPTNANRLAAAKMLNSAGYQQTKYAIMYPISQFNFMLNQRTQDEVTARLATALHIRFALIVLGAWVIIMLWLSYQSLNRTLGGSIDEVRRTISLLAQGDFLFPIKANKGANGSVLSWLAEMQSSLYKIDAEHKQLEKKLESQAQVDYLTNLSNRRYFMEQAEMELSRSRRFGKSLSLLMMDIDFFKKVNDKHGHNAGDEVLRKLADVCRQTLRTVDIVGRMGGEEFAIILPETEMVKALEAAERLRESIAQAKVPMESGLSLQFTVSIGVTSQIYLNDNIDVLLSQADKALYKAKESGRNKVCVATIA
jgi:diguanylate cyclase (GGDEF)-like protein